MNKVLRVLIMFIMATVIITSCKKSVCNECSPVGWSFTANGDYHVGKIRRTDAFYDSGGVSILGYESINIINKDTNFLFLSLDARPTQFNHSLTNIICDTFSFNFFNQNLPGQPQSQAPGYTDNGALGLKATITDYDATTGYLTVNFSGTVYLVQNGVVMNQTVSITDGYFVTKVF